jgi:hypothetical protein
MKCSPGGLAGSHWLIAIILGLLEYPLTLGVKYIPDSICPEFGKKSIKLEDDGPNLLAIRKNRTQSFSLRNPPHASVNKESSGKQQSIR